MIFEKIVNLLLLNKRKEYMKMDKELLGAKIREKSLSLHRHMQIDKKKSFILKMRIILIQSKIASMLKIWKKKNYEENPPIKWANETLNKSREQYGIL